MLGAGHPGSLAHCSPLDGAGYGGQFHLGRLVLVQGAG